METKKMNRLSSLDVLRGFDMFILVLLNPFLLALAKVTPNCDFMQFIKKHSTHVAWEGFTFHDLIMPLFMFVSGVAIPFAFLKYRVASGQFNFDRKLIFRRMLRRVVLLWLLGMVIQGNLLGLDPQHLYFYSNTLQAIAVGYLFASLFYVYTTWKTQIGIAIGLIIVYIAVMTFGSMHAWGIQFGEGSYSFPNNMAEYIDRIILGQFRDGVTWSDQEWSFANWYSYTWILSSLTFIVTTMTGVFAGELLLMSKSAKQALASLVILGISMLTGAWVMENWIPIIKPIWTPSMVLLSSGWSILLLAFFYWIVDMRGWLQWSYPFRVVGSNAIVAYTLGEFFNFSSIVNRLFYGFHQLLPEGWYPILLAFGEALLIYWILWMLYKNHKLIKI